MILVFTIKVNDSANRGSDNIYVCKCMSLSVYSYIQRDDAIYLFHQLTLTSLCAN